MKENGFIMRAVIAIGCFIERNLETICDIGIAVGVFVWGFVFGEAAAWKHHVDYLNEIVEHSDGGEN